MGTNYYLQTDFCPCCGKPRQTLHLGKSSHGWKFLFHQQPRIFDYESFCKVIDTGIIVDEYDNQLSKDDLLDIIGSFQNGKDHEGAEIIGGYNFLDTDFC
jgi:hypothetical protein